MQGRLPPKAGQNALESCPPEAAAFLPEVWQLALSRTGPGGPGLWKLVAMEFRVPGIWVYTLPGAPAWNPRPACGQIQKRVLMVTARRRAVSLHSSYTGKLYPPSPFCQDARARDSVGASSAHANGQRRSVQFHFLFSMLRAQECSE